ncbi:MAG: DUF1566 domain-containing protein [Treponema sp.]|nr:DUF1566 domain-containing protein [Treponema sp.]
MKKLILCASLALAVVVALGSCKHPANEGGGNDDKTTPPVVTVTHEAGGVVLDDGSWIEKADIASLDVAALSGKKVAGISAYEIDGKQYVVAPTTASSKVWAKSGTEGYNTNITAMQGTKEVKQTGENNLAELKKVATDYSEVNYPAFCWAENYGDKKWYIPSIYELNELYQNKAAINAALTKLNSIESSTYPIKELTGYYWSSSQVASNDNGAWLLRFSSGAVDNNDKDNGLVC